MSTSLPPLSIASVVIGFISFSLTLAIWLHSFWEAFLVVGSADPQIRDALSLLRQRLYEELEYLRRMRRRGRDRERRPSKRHRHNHSHSYSYGGDESKEEGMYSDCGPVRVLLDAIKDLIQEFKRCEAPFLVIPGKADGRTEKDLEWSFVATRDCYYSDLPRRLMWLRTKGSITGISDKLQRLQVHRAAVEASECRLMVADTMGLVRDCERMLGRMEDSIRGIEDRLMGAQIGR